MNEQDRRDGRIAVFGAAGHTGRFVVAEIERRGLRALPIGRDAEKLVTTGAAPARVARVDDGASLDAALAGAAAVINCAGPFVDTAIPLVDAALRAGIPYLDVAPEQSVVQSLFEARQDAARAAGVSVVPAAAFYGGLADLLASAIADETEAIDAIDVAVGLDSWHPTAGTRLTGQRNTAPRVIQRRGHLEIMASPPPRDLWSFPAPLGRREVVMQPFSEIITLASHLRADAIRPWMNLEPLQDLRDTATPPPEAIDESGRSAQRFVMEVVVSASGQRRRASASGRDIYHVSAPIVVEAAQRLLTGDVRRTAGVQALGAIVDPRSFLGALVAANVITTDIGLEQESVGGHAE